MEFDILLNTMHTLAKSTADPKTHAELKALVKDIEKNGIDGAKPEDIGLAERLDDLAEDLFSTDRVDYDVYSELKDL